MTMVSCSGDSSRWIMRPLLFCLLEVFNELTGKDASSDTRWRTARRMTLYISKHLPLRTSCAPLSVPASSLT
ncbi:hypothetical protein GALMADRAFT_811754 [Galerina marginata CBS 339.88]|uniref:Uncharacterized protein n=1 Tax=Galerina marginata (strain CBS 339.88) TaxID=685588 RepID=A0A067SVR9_GALM3|nr:hypothetical protein GALMADRAFT_811754 [Galerina marginata CBS 339.88]